MRKLLFILLSTTMALNVIGFLFSETRTISENPVLVDWDFSPEVSTDLGFNLDKGSYGLVGAANIDIESTIIGKANQEFTGSGLAYGSIVAKDIELKVIAENKVDGYNSTDASEAGTSILKLTIGEIIGKIHVGPAYIKLHALSHDEVNISTTDSDFSNIKYNIISPHFTGGYEGKEAVSNVGPATNPSNNTGGVRRELNDDGTDTVSYAFGDTGAVIFGVDLPNLMKVELGASTEFGYNDIQYYDYNPYALSLLVEVNAIENLGISFKTSMQAGEQVNTVRDDDGDATQRKGILDEGNPLAMYLSVDYTLPLGNGLEIAPVLAGDVQFENKQRFAGNIIQIAESQGVGTLDNPSIFTTAFEAGLGVQLFWRSKGVDADESDYLSMSPNDVEVTDGASLTFVYGQVPYIDIRQLSSPYVGVKLAVWESEDGDTLGLVPGLKLGVVANANYALGGTIDIKDDFETQDGTKLYDKYEFTYESRLDVGLGLETSYKYNFIKPYVGLVYKWFDVTDASNKSTQTAVNDSPYADARVETVTEFNDNTRFIVKGDMRAKLGLEVTDIVPFTTFTLEWQSGDLLVDEVADKDISFVDNAFYTNIKDYGAYNTSAQLGYIKLGAKVSF